MRALVVIDIRLVEPKSRQKVDAWIYGELPLDELGTLEGLAHRIEARLEVALETMFPAAQEEKAK